MLPRYDNSEARRLVEERIHSKRNREILILKLVDGEIFLAIAERLDMPVSTVTDAYYKHIRVIFPGP